MVGHIGRFNMQKNHKFIIKVFNEIQKLEPNSILLLIGDGELKDTIENQIDSLGLKSKVKFMGVRKDTFNLYQAMDVFLLPSLFEGLPVVAVEAQDSNLPIIASDTITKEIDLTPNVSFLSLSSAPEIWAKDILNKKTKRRSNTLLLKKKGYDVKDEASKLTEFYSQYYEVK